MAEDEVLVASVQPTDVLRVRSPVEFARGAAVAARACQHQVPYSVQIGQDLKSLQNVREKVIDIRQLCRRGDDLDGPVAVEALALLVTG